MSKTPESNEKPSSNAVTVDGSPTISFRVLNTDLLRWSAVILFIVVNSWANRNYVPRAEFDSFKSHVEATRVKDNAELRTLVETGDSRLEGRLSSLDTTLSSLNGTLSRLQGDRSMEYFGKRLETIEQELKTASAALNRLSGHLEEKEKK